MKLVSQNDIPDPGRDFSMNHGFPLMLFLTRTQKIEQNRFLFFHFLLGRGIETIGIKKTSLFTIFASVGEYRNEITLRRGDDEEARKTGVQHFGHL